MNITRLSIQRPVGITMIIAFFIVLGLYSLSHIGVELLPALNTPYVTVSINYPGAGAEEVEQQIIKPLEDSLSTVPNLKKMTSSARQGNASVVLEFAFSANADIAAIDTTKRVDAVKRSLPQNIQDPVVIKRDINATPIFEIAVTSNKPLETTFDTADKIFKEQLDRIPGVAETVVFGGRQKEIAIEANREKLSFYNISLSQLINKISGETVTTPAGTTYSTVKETDVRLLSEYKTPEEIYSLRLTNGDGVPIPLRELVSIKEQNQRVKKISRANGQEAVSLAIYKNSDANLIETGAAIRQTLSVLEKTYPDYQFVVVNDSSTYVSASLGNTFGSLIEGIFTTGIVLYLFLRGWRSTLAVLVAIPASLLSTLFAMYMAGFTFNMMSLMGMALCIGILVDDSIVVLENIHRHLTMGKNAAEAAESGRNEIGMAAIAITLCDVVVFLPIAFMNGMTGQFFRQFGLAIVFATLFSLFISFTLTPMLASKLYKNGLDHPKGRVWEKFDRFEQAVIRKYENILFYCFKHRKKVLTCSLLVFFAACSLIPLGVIGSEYMPRTDEGSFRATIELPVGKTLQDTDKATAQLEKYILSQPEVTRCLVRVGDPYSNSSSLSVQLTGKKDRQKSIWQITDAVRRYAAQNMAGIDVKVSESQSSIAGVSSAGGRGGGSPAVQIEIRGDDLKALVDSSQKLQQLLREVPGVKDIGSNFRDGMPELELTVDRDKLAYYNTTAADVSKIMNAAISGQQAGVFRQNGDETPIMVRFKNSDSFTASELRNIPIQTGANKVFLGDVARISDGLGPVMIRRVDKQRSIVIQANLTDRPLKEVVQDIQSRLKEQPLPQGISTRFSGQADSMNSTFKEMLMALGLSLVLVYMLLAVLYESFITPVIRMFSLPLGFVGSLIFLAITHNTINLYSLIGILVMDGVVAKNGTLLLDYTLTLMDEGYAPLEAIVEAGKTRLKPIFMTTFTMVVGMLPTALALAEGAEARSSMAWVLIGGLLSSTFFTLVIVPIIFLYFQRHKFSRDNFVNQALKE